MAGSELLGRWSAVRFDDNRPAVPPPADLATIAQALLRRYGVVFRAVLERESLAPPWQHLLRYFRRMEDRGEVLGGRFVDGFSGEQFALPEAVGLLRRQDRDFQDQVSQDRGRHNLESEQGALVVISATDPLNLGGIITPGARTPALNGNRVLLHKGMPVARIQGEEIEVLADISGLSFQQVERLLITVRSMRPGKSGTP